MPGHQGCPFTFAHTISPDLKDASISIYFDILLEDILKFYFFFSL